MLHRAKSAFTLMELLVVLAIIALLLSIIVPSTTKAREQGRQTVCMANLHSIGQAIFVYAEGHNDKLIPGDYDVPWAVWAPVEYEDGHLENKQVNLGHLIVADSLSLPKDGKDTLFCPSMRKSDYIAPDGNISFNYETFDQRWGFKGSSIRSADVNYMLNTQLDGFGTYVHEGKWPILSHDDKIQYLANDGSCRTFNARPVTFDYYAGPETIQQVCFRYGVNFPSAMLHDWVVKEKINVTEAKNYLCDPQGWFNLNATSIASEYIASVPIQMSKLSNKSLVCDVVGVWGAVGTSKPPPPPG